MSAFTYTSRNVRAAAAPLASQFLTRPAHVVMGWTVAQAAIYALAVAQQNLPVAEAGYAEACKALGRANKIKSVMRRFHQGRALRAINVARAQLRAARLAVVSALAAMPATLPN